ncbi:Lipid A export ATP-binding/permease protein MsbA [Methyloversatilis universalis FAM5]|uniref:Lipid A export ATP-binding/permease protein MsbA n=1 Tax=Methyloversatilis universalis (strain ATCC BAA-1314 / DSM 25237 / JCM 13912 / CCUG 52030 / FAM5) TaxID=1000565 RepID=F5RCM6_METUF|nr:lipid A export permease/ATP-binding protein MsbA [Methyloversatilis universalis]EGK71806.1 Lipid A export ATP-binding/permease protein MsbA [Methyloversatilis universalis FAM5]
MTSPQVSSRALYARLLGYVRPYWIAFAVSVVCMALTAAAEPAFPAIMKALLDGGFNGQDPDAIWFYPLAIVLLFVVRGIFGFIADYAFAWAANNVVLDLRRAMFGRLLALPTRFFDNQSSGALISKVAYDVQGVTQAATNVITVFVRDSLTVLGLLAWLLWLNWTLTLIVLGMLPLIALIVRLSSRRIRESARGAQTAMGSIAHTLEETIEAHKVVKIFGGQDYEMGRFEAACRKQRRQNMRNIVAASLVSPMTQVLTAVALGIVIAVALNDSAAQRTTVGGFMGFVTAMLMLLAPLKRLTDVNAPLQRGLAAAESVFQLIDQDAERDAGTIEIARAHGRIDFDQLGFGYPDREQKVLQRFDLSIAPGETVALVGASGSGKTTLAHLLARFYTPTSGRILLDGHDIQNVKLASLRANMALVSQDVVLFNDSVAANIAYGAMRGASREDIEAAARAAQAFDFIQAMPEGFDTLIGENGVKLSGGQRQRLAIARALLKDAPVLILDEATSALDTESERQVQAALEVLMKNRTTLVIAHRLSTIERADRIVVMDRGRIAEIGRHADLLAAGGMYANLYNSQLGGGEQPG